MTPVNENRNWVCPEGYHDVDNDETGQCYSNDEEECPDDYFLVSDPDVEDDGDRCAKPSYICCEEPECKDYLEEQQQELTKNLLLISNIEHIHDYTLCIYHTYS